jgi:hypothetical protein
MLHALWPGIYHYKILRIMRRRAPTGNLKPKTEIVTIEKNALNFYSLNPSISLIIMIFE